MMHLIKSVEKIVVKATNVIVEDVKNDVSGVYEQFKAVIVSVFPFIVTWSEDRERFWTDMGHLSVAAFLFVVFFWVEMRSQKGATCTPCSS